MEVIEAKRQEESSSLLSEKTSVFFLKTYSSGMCKEKTGQEEL